MKVKTFFFSLVSLDILKKDVFTLMIHCISYCVLNWRPTKKFSIELGSTQKSSKTTGFYHFFDKLRDTRCSLTFQETTIETGATFPTRSNRIFSTGFLGAPHFVFFFKVGPGKPCPPIPGRTKVTASSYSVSGCRCHKSYFSNLPISCTSVK